MTAETGQRGPSVRARRAVPPGDSVLRGRALITGGTSGIGLSFAHALAARGCDLVLVARDEARLEKTAEQLRWRYGVDVETRRADLADRGDVAAVAARLEDPDSPVEILVNNAGRGLHVRLLDADTTEHENALDLMVRAVLVLGGAAGRAMRARGHGVIINVSSVAGLIPMGMYSAIKIVGAHLLREPRPGAGRHRVRVTTLLPGWVRTEFHERAGIRASSIPGALWLEADDVVAECLGDVKGRLRSVPSKRFAVLAFLAEHGPRPAVRRVTAQLSRSRR